MSSSSSSNHNNNNNTIASSSGGGEEKVDLEKEFVNQGFLKWEQARAKWLASSMSQKQQQQQTSDENNNNNTTNKSSSSSSQAVPLEVDDIIDVIFSPRWRNPATAEEEGPPRRFPQNVPLPQMVDVLVDLWEAEGLDM